MGRVGSNERQKEFVKEYQRLCYRFGRHEVWQDFVWMAASAISNAVDKTHAEKREAHYLQIIKKYSRDELEVFPLLFALIVDGMEQYPDQDFLGELYMQLELSNDRNGQFFTPYHLCKAMSLIAIDTESRRLHEDFKKQGYISINDPACGAGATLIAAAMVLKEKGVNCQQNALFVAQDIDYTVGLMCYIQLSLLGCAGYVHIGNTLTDPMTGHVLFGDGKETTWYTPMYFSDVWATRRAAERFKGMLRRFAPPPTVLTSGPDSNIEDVAETQETPLQPPTDTSEPTFTVSSKKKNAGQLMFDFGGM